MSARSASRAKGQSHSVRAQALGLMMAGLSIGLVACGGSATVDSTTQSIAPLERGTGSTAAAGESTTAQASSSATATRAAAATTAKDQGAREVSEVPATAAAPATEQAYVAALAKAGINVSGIEDQLVGAAHAACNPDDNVTVNAAAGQLIAQGRTQLAQEKVVEAIQSNAQAEICR